MTDKAKNLIAFLKKVGAKCYAVSPVVCGVAVGYIFKPEIKLAVDAALAVVKGIIKL